ncbi:MAG: nickel pincer cofactor biosynthesis protein LarC [Gemmatimonadota bacterium]|nr:MAG: nickel pincer cofactor biosynthesis protein LarC [Gemmatimonadota bacterium]
MRIAILDPAAGISGDMTLGALLDAGVDRQWLEALPGRLGFASVGVAVRRVDRASVAATKVDFEIPAEGAGDGHGRHVGALLDLVRRAPVSEGVRDKAVRAFELLGEAEGRIHGVAPDAVHLHEVGAVDAVLDIVGAIEGFERLGVDAVYNLPVAIGDGWVEAAHGHLPVPAPATAILLEGVEVRSGGPVTGEATTPTGAALVRVLSQGAPPPRWRLVASGWGAGTRDPAHYPGALRLLLAEAAAEAGVLETIATDVDDLAPEYVEPLRAALFQAGAVECSVWPTQGKKGRVSLRLEALAAPEHAERVIEALFAHSTTAGVRRWTTTRATLPRRELVVELDSGARVRIKVREGASGTRLKPEYDDVIAAADALGRPALEIAREAERQAEAVLRAETSSRE